MPSSTRSSDLVVAEQAGHVTVLASLRTEVYGHRMHRLRFSPCRKDIDFAAGGLDAYSFRGQAQNPGLSFLLPLVTRIANKLNHGVRLRGLDAAKGFPERLTPRASRRCLNSLNSLGARIF